MAEKPEFRLIGSLPHMTCTHLGGDWLAQAPGSARPGVLNSCGGDAMITVGTRTCLDERTFRWSVMSRTRAGLASVALATTGRVTATKCGGGIEAEDQRYRRWTAAGTI